MEEKQNKWKERIAELPKTNQVFLDGSGANTNMTRRYGRATGKQRVADAVPLYLPPYSPNFNPIEKMWSRMKAVLRKMRVCSQDLLDPAVQEPLSAVSASNCKGRFHCVGF